MSETKLTETERRKIWGVHPNVFFLGLTSLLTDISSEMMFTLVPLFLSNVLGAGTTIIGLVGGLSDSTEAVFKIFSGRLSDKIHRPKLLTALGYAMSTIVKPFMFLANNWDSVTLIRMSDRVGKGVRESPRDALLADSISPQERGRSFGLRQAMDTTGAVIGLSLAAIIIYAVQGSTALRLNLQSYHWMVWGSILPAVLAVAVLLIFVRETKRIRHSLADGQGSTLKSQTPFSSRFKIYLAILAVFTLGNSSDFFVILRAQNLEVPLVQVVAMLVLFNVIYALTALPMGILSDKVGRKSLIIIGWSVYALIYLGFAFAVNIWQTWVLFAGYGIYYGAFAGVGKAFVADLVPAERRGTAYGLYNGVMSLFLLPASLLAGWLWDAFNPEVPFYLGAALSFIAMLGVVFLIKEPRPASQKTAA